MEIKQKLISQIEHLMIKNRRQHGKYSYTVPSPVSYPFQWFWDSCFHAIILSYFDINAAKSELYSLSSKQFKNGMIPHMIYWENPKKFHIPGVASPVIPWGTNKTSSIVQPPMLAYATWVVYEKSRDIEFLKRMLPVIADLHKYLLKLRDPNKHHLAGLVHPDESGEDNSPRFDDVLQLKAKQTIDANYHRRLILVDRYKIQQFKIKKHMENFHWVRDVPFNAILVNALVYESLIAGELQLLKQSSLARQHSDEIAAAMREYMLDGVLMMSTMGHNYHHIKVKTWSIFIPLFANILTPEEANELIEKHLKNKKEFKSRFLLPTVAMDEPSFDPNGFWRGPVWMSTNWFIFKGLLNYGYRKEANEILNDSINLLSQHGLREHFNPLSGEPLGAIDFTWGGLVIDMINSISI
ncbi:MAG TPA: trehalase family glycosidase [Patescibacteria group bacterium]|nr:trehalase family glycosidase [Patescibacteria group bacterium]